MFTLTGSSAAKLHFPDFRTPKDVDYHAPFQEDPAPAGDVFIDERLGRWGWGPVASPEELYTMKVSHSFWEIGDTNIRREANWNKHMADIVFFQRKGVGFNRELYDILVPIWKDIYKKKITNLNQGQQSFFDDAVPRKYVHDSIHESVAYGDEPLFKSILVPGEQVMVDSSIFFDKMDHDTQMKLVREEVYTTALERIIIPNNYTGSPSAAYAWALRRTITSLFKNEWALWAVLNYEALARPDCNYQARHLENKHRLVSLDNP